MEQGAKIAEMTCSLPQSGAMCVCLPCLLALVAITVHNITQKVPFTLYGYNEDISAAVCHSNGLIQIIAYKLCFLKNLTFDKFGAKEIFKCLQYPKLSLVILSVYPSTAGLIKSLTTG